MSDKKFAEIIALSDKSAPGTGEARLRSGAVQMIGTARIHTRCTHSHMAHTHIALAGGGVQRSLSGV